MEQRSSRREFIKKCGIWGLSLSFSPLFYFIPKGWTKEKNIIEAYYYRKLSNNKVQCLQGPRRCILPPKKRSFCRVRENRGGKLYSFVFGNPCAVHIDPIEKKPFYHVLPSSKSFSIATAGCNLRCKFCQNWQISQRAPEDLRNYNYSPKEIVFLAKKYKCASIAYTYTEPTIFYEYMIEIAKIASKEKILNVCHSNGFINPKPLKRLCKYLKAANIDLKGFSNKYYREMSSAWLKPVLNTLKILREEGVHIEITNLMIPTKNDNPDLVKRMCGWILKNLGEDTPIHFSRFYPMYKLLNLPPTPVETLEMAYKIALKEGLKFVYIGNVVGHKGESTYCPKCKKTVIKRIGYHILKNEIKEGKCGSCKEVIKGIWRT
jgi:pyruvate formate lyase activating enzyme